MEHPATGRAPEARHPIAGHGVAQAMDGPPVPRFVRKETGPRATALPRVGHGKVAQGRMAVADRPSNVPLTTGRRDARRFAAARPTRLLPVPRPRADSVLVVHGGRARRSTPAVSRADLGAAIVLPSAVRSRVKVATVLPSSVRSMIAGVATGLRIVVPGKVVAAMAAEAAPRFATVPRARAGNPARALPDRARVRAPRTRRRLRRRVPMILATSTAAGWAAIVPHRVHAHGSAVVRQRIVGSAGAGMQANVANAAAPRERNGRHRLPAHASNGPRFNGRHESWRGRVLRGLRTGSCGPR